MDVPIIETNMVYYRNPSNNEVYGYDLLVPTDLPYIQTAINNGWENITGSYPPPPDMEQLLSDCKQEATTRLVETDWSQMPDVTDVNNTPHLLNVQEFFTYREFCRNLVVNPIENPIFPNKPIAEWSN
jgi:hypothetical protein